MYTPQPLSAIRSVEVSEWISSLELWASGIMQIAEIKLSRLDRRGDDNKDTFADSASSPENCDER
ncbi:hypothetical protein P3T76_005255 [Phytophthora citrophthora]|uniref:Uncharacterized protein n=1 Tax=Phytophthora citrophthora TaxID=4793 RepID=A0AAD9GRU4_9STRA|nr:hypothetical protein P3T76_005255 [Phytophthora citrophthora]